MDKNDVSNNTRRFSNSYFNGFQHVGIDSTKKEYSAGDSGNSTAKDFKSTVTDSFASTKSKVVEIAQRFPLNQSETRQLKTQYTVDGDLITYDEKPSDEKKKLNFELTKVSDGKEQNALDVSQIKTIIQNQCDLIKNELENTIRIKENVFR